MDKHWVEAAWHHKAPVGVVMGALAAEVNPHEAAPMVRKALVVEKAQAPASTRDDVWWCLVTMAEGLEPIPQMMREDEILGFWPNMKFVSVEGIALP